MGLFLRGNVWWMEYRTRRVRKVLSTGFRKCDKEKAKAAFDAFRLGMGAKPRRSAMEGILSAIYDEGEKPAGIALSSVWRIYEDWMSGKGRVVAKLTQTNRRNLMDRFVVWCGERGLTDVSDVSVVVARDFIRSLGLSNKTQRTYAQYLSGIWRAVGQMVGVLANPWPAASPDNDGSSVRREAFTEEEERRVLASAKKVGHGWWLASVLSRWTGLRYGDVARLEWGAVDLRSGTLRLVPHKTKRHRVSVVIPISGPLMRALSAVKVREGFVLPEHALAYPKPMDVPFSAVLADAGLGEGGSFTFHSWRHTFRTRLAEAGVSDETARRMGGWTSLSMAAHYDHASHLAEMRAAIGRMEGQR